MNNKLKFAAGLLGLVIVAGGAAYYGLMGQSDETLLTALNSRGISYENVAKDANGTLNFIKPTLDIGQATPIALGSLTALKARTGYDLIIENLELPLEIVDAKLTLPHMEIKALEFVDKIDATPNGLPTQNFLAPFLHDKAASIRFEKPSISWSFIFNDATFTPHLQIDEILFDSIKQGKITHFHNTGIHLSVNASSEFYDRRTPHFGNLIESTLEKQQIQDFDLKRFLEVLFLATENPDAPFEEIYSSMKIENFQFQSWSNMIQYSNLRASAGKVRSVEKAPVKIFQEIIALQDLLTGEYNWQNDSRIPTFYDNVVLLIKMFGEQEIIAENILQKQMIAAFDTITATIAQVRAHMKGETFDVGYNDVRILNNKVEAQIGKVEMHDFAYLRLVNSLHAFFKTVSEYQGAIGQEDGMSEKAALSLALNMIPQFGVFSIEDFHIKGTDNNELKDMIGEWSIARIALTNSYDFDQALVPTSSAIEFKNISIPANVMDLASFQTPQLRIAGCLLKDEDINISLYLKGEWNQKTKTVTFADNFYEDNMIGKVRLLAQFGNVPEHFFSLTPLPTEEDAKKLSFQNLQLSYDPQGKETVIWECIAQGFGTVSTSLQLQAAAALQMGMIPGMIIPAEERELQQKIIPLIKEAITFIQQGGKIAFSLKAPTDQGLRFDELETEANKKGNPFNLFDLEAIHTAPDSKTETAPQ